MRRLISISAVLALIVSVGSPALVSAYVAGKAPMACHRAILHEDGQGMKHQHCNEMEGMDMAVASPEEGDGAVIGALAAKCPMECCTLAGTTGQASPASPLILAAQVVVERNIPAVKVVFSRNGFSSHTDRGPPTA
jgi:hypothetical protein